MLFSFRSEAGASLVEVLVSMVALVTLALGVFAGLDSASRASGLSKARTVAAALAQEDQERMRTLRVADLANRSTDTVRVVDGVSYTVRSEASYVQDSAGTTSCSSDSRADYITIVSEVSWPAMGATRPVRLESIVAPPTGSFSPTTGSLAVSVRNGAGAGVAGVSLRLTGPASYGQTTNALGCALFAYIEPGTWTLEASAPGFVDPNGNPDVTRTVSVTAQNTTVVAVDYARAADVEVTFDTKRPAAADPQPARAEVVTAAHPTMQAPGTRLFPAGGGSPVADYESLSVAGLFPFGSAYGLYSGACPANEPTQYGASGQLLTAEPGDVYTAVVREPALDVAVSAGGEPVDGATVVISSADAGCGNRFERSTDATGRLAEPGLPFGHYVVCATHSGRRVIVPDVANTDPAGRDVVLPDLVGPSSQEGTCDA